MTDQDVVDALEFNFETPKLHLGSLPAIYKEITFSYIYKLGTWIAFGCRSCRTAAQDGHFKILHKEKILPFRLRVLCQFGKQQVNTILC